jgi:tetratricopeptide (TPR) repeat protein
MSPNTYVRVIAIAAAAMLLCQPGFSQGRAGTAPPGGNTGGNSGGNAGNTPTTGRMPTSIPTNPNNTTPTTQPSGPPQPIFLSGRVMLEDGTAPTQQVTIERVCNGVPRAEGYTDSKGYFSIQLGAERGMLQDASEASGGGGQFGGFGDGGGGGGGGFGGGGGLRGGGMSPGSQSRMGSGMGTSMNLMSCDLQAKLAGYRSQVVSLAGRRPMDDPNMGVILLHRVGPSEGSTVSVTSLNAPKDARKAFDKGLDASKKHKTDEAEKDYQKAVEVYPKYAAAWYELGKIQATRGQKDEARKSFDAAVEADPKFVSPYLQISLMAVQAQQWKEAADVTERAVKLDPFDYPQAFFFNAVANYNLKNLEAAEKSGREAERLDTRHQIPRVAYLMGVLLAQRGDYNGAVEHFKAYLKLAPEAEDADAVRSQLTQLEKMTAQVDKQQ